MDGKVVDRRWRVQRQSVDGSIWSNTIGERLACLAAAESLLEMLQLGNPSGRYRIVELVTTETVVFTHETLTRQQSQG